MTAPASDAVADGSTKGRGGRARWGIAGVLGFGMFVNYIDRVNLSIATPAIIDDFNISNAQMGMVASAFLWTYTMLQLPVGPILDRIGVGWANRVAALIWAVASFLSAMAGGLGLLLVSRLILGIGEAPTIPAGWKATGQWFPRAERGTATAIFDGCAKISNVAGIPIMAFLITTFSWHAAFIFTGALSLLYFAVWWLLYLSPKQALARGRLSESEYTHLRAGDAEDEDVQGENALKGFGYLLLRRKTWGLTLGYAAYTYAYYVLLTWLPSYLERQFGVNLLQGGIYTMVPWLVAVLAQFLIAGIVMDRWIQRTGNITRIRRIFLVGSMSLALAVTGAAYADSIVVALVFLSLGASGLAISVPAGASIVSLIAPEGYTGTLGGIVNFVANLLGIAAPILTGMLVDVSGSFSSAFLATGGVLLGGIVCYTIVLGRMERIPAPASS